MENAICQDMFGGHYFNHGGFGAITLREPMVLGHEVSGVVAELGDGTTGMEVVDLVAVSPSRPCRTTPPPWPTM